MIKDKSIYIKNIYYMLSYAFQILKQSNYDEIASEKFEDAQDLFAAILSNGVFKLVKQGLRKEYISNADTISTIKGKMGISQKEIVVIFRIYGTI